jgi:cyclohexadieny/prephenate dehydrogenase
MIERIPESRRRRGIVEIGQDSAAPDFGRPHPPLAKKAE